MNNYARFEFCGVVDETPYGVDLRLQVHCIRIKFLCLLTFSPSLGHVAAFETVSVDSADASPYV